MVLEVIDLRGKKEVTKFVIFGGFVGGDIFPYLSNIYNFKILFIFIIRKIKLCIKNSITFFN